MKAGGRTGRSAGEIVALCDRVQEALDHPQRLDRRELSRRRKELPEVFDECRKLARVVLMYREGRKRMLRALKRAGV